MYYVEYDTLAICEDGTIRNLSQGKGICYTNYPINMIEQKIKERLKEKNLFPVIEQITKIKRWVMELEGEE